ncbi:MAG: DNA primase [Planctomycetes bacterium]|nr:DNA primase [Planctomycetota bacterium]
MGLISRDSIEEVRRANDIVAVIEQYVKLEKRGKDFWACCPFHQEKTGSFSVSPSREMYYCFGCKEHGNVVDFVMKFEKLAFPEAVEKLAARAGLQLTYEKGGPTQQDRSLRDKAFEILTLAQKYFLHELKRSPAANDYLKQRGLDGDVAQRWGIGYAPDEWSKLTDLLLERGKDLEAVLASGVARKNDSGRIYDFYRGRVTFPIHDAQGRIVGFGGRLLDPEAKTQKYINSPEGPLFSKSKLLYGLDKLAGSQRMKKDGRALIMEGYTDVIAAHEAGFDNAVAPLGTALTAEQVQLLRRYGSGIALVLDGDAAGIAGAERGLNIVLEAGVDATVAIIPGGMDPFDLIRAEGPEAFEKVLKNQRDAFDFKLEMVRSRFNLSRPAEVTGAVAELAELLARVEDERLRGRYQSYAATALKLRESQIMLVVADALAKSARREQREERNEPRSSVSDPGRGSAQTAQGARGIYERRLIARLMEMPQNLPAAGETVEAGAFSSEGLRELYVALLNAWDEHGSVVPGSLYAHLKQAGRDELEEVLRLLDVPASQEAMDKKEAQTALLDELKRFAHGPGQTDGRGSLEALRKSKTRDRKREARSQGLRPQGS